MNKKNEKKTEEQLPMVRFCTVFVFLSLISIWIWEIDEMLAGVIHPKQQLSEMELRIEEGRLPKNKIPVVK